MAGTLRALVNEFAVTNEHDHRVILDNQRGDSADWASEAQNAWQPPRLLQGDE